MSQKLIWVALMALLTLVSPSWATELPTSEYPAEGNWTHMRANSFKGTIEDAYRQCQFSVAGDKTGRLTAEKCETFKTMLETQQCQKVLVKDGVVISIMNGMVGGKHRLTFNVKKKLGREDPAFSCDLGNQVHALWFSGVPKESCENVAFIFAMKPPAPIPGVCGNNAKHYSHTNTNWPADGKFCAVGTQSQPFISFPNTGSNTFWTCEGPNGGTKAVCPVSRDAVPPPPPPPPIQKTEAPPAKQCRIVQRRYIVSEPGQSIFIPGLSVAVCRGQVYIPDNFVNIPSSVMVVSKDEEVCN